MLDSFLWCGDTLDSFFNFVLTTFFSLSDKCLFSVTSSFRSLRSDVCSAWRYWNTWETQLIQIWMTTSRCACVINFIAKCCHTQQLNVSCSFTTTTDIQLLCMTVLCNKKTVNTVQPSNHIRERGTDSFILNLATRCTWVHNIAEIIPQSLQLPALVMLVSLGWCHKLAE